MWSVMASCAAAGRWLASVNGVAAGLSAALIVTAYGAMVPALEDDQCVVVRASLAGVAGGRDLMLCFLIGGSSALLAGCLPTAVQFFGLMRRLHQTRAGAAEPPPYVMTERAAVWIAPIQIAVLIMAFGVFAWNTADALRIAAWHTPERVAEWRRTELLPRCTAQQVTPAPSAAEPAPPRTPSPPR
jgi:hypothetical protein